MHRCRVVVFLLLSALALAVGLILHASTDVYEPNENWHDARLIPVGQEIEAIIASDTDTDWFKFAVVEGQEIQVDLYGDVAGLPDDYDLYLFDSLGVHQATSNNGGVLTERIIHTAQHTGEYRAKVLGYDGAYHITEPYTLIVTVGPLCEEAITNGGFDTGDFADWSTVGTPWIADYDGHDALNSGVVGGADDADDTFYQTVDLPASVESARLTFWWLVYTQEGGASPNDYLFVEAQATDGTVLGDLFRLDNQAATGDWFEETIDLRDWPALFGQTIRIAFHGTTSESLFTSFYIDDVSLEICAVPEAATSTPTTEPSVTPSLTPTVTRTPADELTPTPTDEPVPTATSSLLPDLVVTDFWMVDDDVHYQIQNIGSASVPDAGYGVSLQVDSVEVDTDLIVAEIPPDGRYEGVFGLPLACAGFRVEVLVHADASNDLTEGSDDNNARFDWVLCDRIPPGFVGEPVLSDITEDGVTVHWTLNEPGTGEVNISQGAGSMPQRFESGTLETDHTVVITGLLANRTYAAGVRTCDESGHWIESGTLWFETLASSDSVDPTVSLVDPGTCTGVVSLAANASDAGGIEKVAFSVDGVRFQTDYSSPWTAKLDTTAYLNESHYLSATAWDRAGNSDVVHVQVQFDNLFDSAAPSVDIQSPSNRSVVGGDVTVSALVFDDAGLDITTLYIDGVSRQVVVHGGRALSETVTFPWDTRSVLNGDYSLGVLARDKDGRTFTDSVDVTVANAVPVAQPNVWVRSQTLTRSDNRFSVELKVTNHGDGVAKNVKVIDGMRGFQPIAAALSQPTQATYKPRVSSPPGRIECVIASLEDLAPGATQTFTFDVVPIVDLPSQGDYRLGDKITLSFAATDGTPYERNPKGEVNQDAAGLPLLTAVYGALERADYALVTHPTNLRSHDWRSVSDTDALLSDMAQLAAYKSGMLVYLHASNATSARHDLLQAIHPDGFLGWSLHPNFRKTLQGYLLIVGESEIVPSFDVPHGGATVWLCDQPYADTVGADALPELVVGRIPGSTSAKLDIPIRTAIALHEGQAGYSFDGSHALCVSGGGSMSDDFVWDIDWAVSELDDRYVVDRLDCRKQYAFRDLGSLLPVGSAMGVGDCIGDAVQEVIVADSWNDQIKLYSPTGMLIGDLGVGFRSGDGFAVGDVWGGGSDDIVVADNVADKVTTFDGAGVQRAQFSVSFDEDDLLRIGDLIAGGKLEIVVIDVQNGGAKVYDTAGSLLRAFATPYRLAGDVGIGDILGDAADELIVGEPGIKAVTIMSSSGTVLTKHGSDFDPHDRIVCGDVFADHKDEILVADASTGLVACYYSKIPKGQTEAERGMRTWVHFESIFVGDGDVAIGQIDGQDKLDMLIGSYMTEHVKAYHLHCDARNVTGIQPKLAGKDLIFFSDHGEWYVWSDTLHTGHPVSFGGSNPFCFAAACLTGRYHTLRDVGIAEHMLANGASLYLGSTTNTQNGPDRALFKMLLPKMDTGQSVGLSFSQVERDLLGPGNDWLVAVRQYNLYGDPKIGGGPTLTGASDDVITLADAPSEITIDVPDYVVEQVGRGDQVTIPGGSTTSAPNEPELPTYAAEIVIPAGYQVQAARLISQADAQETQGLTILPPLVETKTASVGATVSADLPDDVWYPLADPWAWRVFENAEGTTTLSVLVHPFRYQPATTRAEFTDQFVFDIETAPTPLTVSVTTDKLLYDPGEDVTVALTLTNSAEAMDVIIQTSLLRTDGSGVVDGLLNETLADLEGTATFSPVWDGGDETPGYYVAETAARSSGGTVLARARTEFRLGAPDLRLENLAMTPAQPAMGDDITFSLDLRNAGSIPITATLFVDVVDAGGNAYMSWESGYPFTGVGTSHAWSSTWATLGEPGGQYSVMANATYDGASTPIGNLTFVLAGGDEALWLPMIQQ